MMLKRITTLVAASPGQRDQTVINRKAARTLERYAGLRGRIQGIVKERLQLFRAGNVDPLPTNSEPKPVMPDPRLPAPNQTAYVYGSLGGGRFGHLAILRRTGTDTVNR